MERYNFLNVEKKWRKKNSQSVANKKSKKNIIVWKCFLIHLEKYTWAMLEIIL